MSFIASRLCAPGRRITQPTGRLALLALLLVICGTYGCAVPIRMASINRDIPKETMPLLVRAGLDSMSDPETQRRVQSLLADPQMHAISRELVAGLVDGTLATLNETERAERISALTTRAMTGMLRGVTRELSSGVAEVTDSALAAAMTPAHRREIEALLGAVVSTIFRAAAQGLQEAEIGKHLATAMTEQLGPALKQTMRDDVAPGLAELLKNEELNKALGATARTLGREMVLGATEALAQTQQPKDDGSLLSRATELAHQGARLFGSAAWLLLVVIIALLLWTLKLRAQAKNYREEADRRAVNSHFLAEASKISQGKPWSDELISALQERIRAEEEAIAELRQVKRGASPHPGQPPSKNGHSRPA